MLSGGSDDSTADSAGATGAVGAAVVPAGFTEMTKAAAMEITQPVTKRMLNVRFFLFFAYCC